MIFVFLLGFLIGGLLAYLFASRKNREEAIRLATEKDYLTRRIEESQIQFDDMKSQLKLQFELLAQQIFEQKTSQFKKQSTEDLSTILSPLKEKLQEFQQKMDHSLGEQAKDQASLKTQLQHILEMNRTMSVQADNLTRALKGDIRVQGNWGEVMLEKILEGSGLRQGIDYHLQGESLALKHPETGYLQKPDVVVDLPDNKHIIIDAKVSLKAYEAFIAEEEASRKAQFLKEFIFSVKEHIHGLEKRCYQYHDKLNTPDFVLMFMPIEGAFSLALQNEVELHRYAWDRKIVLVSPTTLFVTLRTVASLWKLETQNRNVSEIAKTGGALYDKIADFMKHFEKLGQQIDSLKKTHEASFTSLSGRGGMLRQAQKLKELGAKNAKELPVQFLELEEEER